MTGRKKTKARSMTLRQRVRAGSERKLESLLNTVRILVTEALKADSTEINPSDVMRLVAGSQTTTLRVRVITELANEKEAELERIYNNQQDLPLAGGEADGD